MIFKPWAELPPPRHLLTDEEDVDYSEDSPLPNYLCTFSNPVSSLSKPPSRLIVVSSRLVPLFRDYEQNSIVSSIHINDHGSGAHSTQRPYQLELPIFSTVDPNDPSSSSSSEFALLLPLAPHIPPLASAAIARCIAKEIAQSPQPIEILIAAPTNGASAGTVGTLDRPLAHLQTSAYAQQPLTSTRSVLVQASSPLLPPQSLQGTAAAILSAAELNNLHALAIIVDAEGPQDFEQMNPDGIFTLASVLRNGFGWSKVLKTLPSASSRMYF